MLTLPPTPALPLITIDNMANSVEGENMTILCYFDHTWANISLPGTNMITLQAPEEVESQKIDLLNGNRFTIQHLHVREYTFSCSISWIWMVETEKLDVKIGKYV